MEEILAELRNIRDLLLTGRARDSFNALRGIQSLIDKIIEGGINGR
jgi:hypothetical protein